MSKNTNNNLFYVIIRSGLILGKFFGWIDWKWWQVLLPTEILLIILLICIFIVGLAEFFKK